MTIILIKHKNKGLSLRVTTKSGRSNLLRSNSTAQFLRTNPLHSGFIDSISSIFFSPRPCFDLFLACDGISYVYIEFEIDKLVSTLYRFVNPRINFSWCWTVRLTTVILGNAGVEDSVVFIGENVDGRFPLSIHDNPPRGAFCHCESRRSRSEAISIIDARDCFAPLAMTLLLLC